MGQLYSENFSSSTTNFTTYLNYDAANRLYQVSDPFTGTVVGGNPFGSGQAVTAYSYDMGGRITQRTDPSGLTWVRCYDTHAGMTTAQYVVNGADSCSNPPSSPAQSSVYGYDPAGNVVYDKETVQGAGTLNGENDYTYDPADRLWTYNPPSLARQTYNYDGAGNRTKVAINGGTTTTVAYDTRGLPSSQSVGSTQTYYCYDAAGNLIDEGLTTQPTCPSSGSSGGMTGATRSYNYDTWSRMSSAKIGSTSYSYSYDALYRLVSSSAPSLTFSYAGSSADPIEQQGPSTVYYAYSPHGPLAQGTPGTASSANYFLKDFHGDVVGLANNSGGSTSVSGWATYDPWGTVIGSGSGSATLGFQGQLTDSSTKFVKTATRYYDPAMGAFTARDALFGQAIDPNSLNQYTYGNDTPVGYDDPSGLAPYGCVGKCWTNFVTQTNPAVNPKIVASVDTATGNPTTLAGNDPPPAPPTVSQERLRELFGGTWRLVSEIEGDGGGGGLIGDPATAGGAMPGGPLGEGGSAAPLDQAIGDMIDAVNAMETSGAAHPMTEGGNEALGPLTPPSSDTLANIAESHIQAGHLQGDVADQSQFYPGTGVKALLDKIVPGVNTYSEIFGSRVAWITSDTENVGTIADKYGGGETNIYTTITLRDGTVVTMHPGPPVGFGTPNA